MRTSSIVWTIVVLIVIIGIGWFVFAMPQNSAMQTATVAPSNTTAANNSSSTTAATTNTTPNTASSNPSAAGSAPMAATVTFTNSGWSPSTVTIAKGGTVTFINKSSGQMWVASDPHPTHQGYDGTTESQHCAPGYTGPAPLDECANNDTFTFTFNKAGSWGYHNHDASEDQGTVIVQ